MNRTIYSDVNRQIKQTGDKARRLADAENERERERERERVKHIHIERQIER